jgi:uncharacterized protein (TIGR03435 family)
MKRRILSTTSFMIASFTIAGLFLLGFGAAAQKRAAFEVASIKAAPPYTMESIHSGQMKLGLKIDGARAEFGAMTLTDLIARAYGVRTFQVSGPGWIGSERYDIIAKLPDGATTDQIPEMLQSLLAERFKLSLRRESKEYPVYALVVAKDGGIKFAARPDGYNPDAKNTGRPMTLDAYADMLSRAVDRPVVDMTNLKGEYMLSFTRIMQEMGKQMAARGGTSTPPETAGGPADSGAFEIVQDLGLKLEPRRVPLALLVVEHAEKVATEN